MAGGRGDAVVRVVVFKVHHLKISRAQRLENLVQNMVQFGRNGGGGAGRRVEQLPLRDQKGFAAAVGKRL